MQVPIVKLILCYVNRQMIGFSQAIVITYTIFMKSQMLRNLLTML